MKERKYHADWLMVIAMLSVFVFHCTRFFCTEDWHLKVPASEQSDVLVIVRGFLFNTWFMELFILVAGFASFYSLRRRTGVQYLAERVKRILIPLYTVGLFILVVPQNYIDWVTHGYITDNFWQWLPSYYGGLLARFFFNIPQKFLDPVNLVLYSFSGHLCFIQMLFLISLLMLPVILSLRIRLGPVADRPTGGVVCPPGWHLPLRDPPRHRPGRSPMVARDNRPNVGRFLLVRVVLCDRLCHRWG